MCWGRCSIFTPCQFVRRNGPWPRDLPSISQATLRTLPPYPGSSLGKYTGKNAAVKCPLATGCSTPARIYAPYMSKYRKECGENETKAPRVWLYQFSGWIVF